MPADASQPDLLFFFSDQHDGRKAGYAGDPVVETPNLDRLAAEGTVCANAYTPCPLCVPARSALLSGQLPSRTGIFSNGQHLRSDRATFLHTLALAGYETVLVGRMHFKGPDQRHGFTRRVFGDITAVDTGGIPNGGPFGYGMNGCMDVLGGGDSPVLGYDREVIEAALAYLRQDHDRPQCIVVGTYGPHFPYVAPPDLYRHYRERVTAPASWTPETPDPNPIVDGKRQRDRRSPIDGSAQPVDEEALLAARAAYYGMIALIDRQVGQVRDAWQDRLDRTGRPGVFVYSSDHGDTCGEHGVFGKQTFYDGSTRVPLLFEGATVRAGGRLEGATTLLDIGPTLAAFGGAETPPDPDGRSLVDDLRDGTDDPERAVLSEWVHHQDEATVPGRMIRKGRWKLIRYLDAAAPDQLFDITADPEEMDDRLAAEPAVAAALAEELEAGWNAPHLQAVLDRNARHLRIVSAWAQGGHLGTPDPIDQWRVPDALHALPEIAAAP
ncbi:MAG: sulfatase-like hydrolase/transferase [Planctomycetota bacterium]